MPRIPYHQHTGHDDGGALSVTRGAAPGGDVAAEAAARAAADAAHAASADPHPALLSNPMTTAGDLILGGAAGAPGRLGVGTDSHVLTVDSGTHLPAWKAATGGASVGTATPLVESGAGSAGTAAAASREDHVHPAASGSGTLSTVEEADGSPTDSAVTKLVFPNGTLSIASHVATYTPASGSGVGWTQGISESGASFASWTATAGGTWASNGTEITQTDTAGAWRRAYYTAAKHPILVAGIIEAEVWCATGGGTNRVGIGITDGTNTGYGIVVNLAVGTEQKFLIDRDNSVTLITSSQTLSTSTWYTVRLVLGSVWATGYLGGTLIGSGDMAIGSFGGASQYLTLLSYGASAKFRNVKMWTATTTLP